MNGVVFTIDNFGNMIDESGNYVGYYDTQEKACILFNTGQNVPCPDNMKEPTAQPVVKDSRTFYWVVLVGFILLVLLGSYIYFKTKGNE